MAKTPPPRPRPAAPVDGRRDRGQRQTGPTFAEIERLAEECRRPPKPRPRRRLPASFRRITG